MSRWFQEGLETSLLTEEVETLREKETEELSSNDPHPFFPSNACSGLDSGWSDALSWIFPVGGRSHSLQLLLLLPMVCISSGVGVTKCH